MKIGSWIAFGSLLAMLAATAWIEYDAWMTPFEPRSRQAYTAMGLCAVMSVMAGCGLMALLFSSGRHGYDEPQE
jgi:hypothetical protein